jgi:hypothetical protein
MFVALVDKAEIALARVVVYATAVAVSAAVAAVA